MPAEDTYELYIDAFTPDTITLASLAGYMAKFADVLGFAEHIHFGTLKSGSLSIAPVIDPVIRPKIDRRMADLQFRKGPAPALKALTDIDDQLAADNAVGHISCRGLKVIEFPGRTRQLEIGYGPVIETGTLDGEVIQIGGRDETINVHLKTADQICVCVTGKAIARRLAPHLFGSPVRVRGTGNWTRSASGAWSLKKFQIEDFLLQARRLCRSCLKTSGRDSCRRRAEE